MKNIGMIITVITLLCGIAVGYGQLTQKTEDVVKEVAEVKVEVKEIKGEEKIQQKELVEMQKFDIQQSMILERIVEKLDKMER